MIYGAHLMLVTTDPDADRDFIRDVLGFHCIDGGGGYSIFEMPPTELAIHMEESTSNHDLFFMCDDVQSEHERLTTLSVKCGAVETAEWGRSFHLTLPSGSEIGIYEPTHPLAITR